MQEATQESTAAVVRLLLVFVLFSFLFHFAWEILQTPFFAHMPSMDHWVGTVVCLRAAIGDVLIALGALAAGAFWSKRLDWVLDPSWQAIAIYVLVGELITIALEWHAVYWANRWTYSQLMPIVPLLRVGLLPILQWLVLPPIILYFVRRHFISRP